MLAVNAREDELDDVAKLCRHEHLGIELTGFAFHTLLDVDLEARIARHVEGVRGIEPVASHGPFVDLYVTSRDPEIVAVCRRRHEQALAASRAVGASVYVAHLNSIPLIRNQEDQDRFVRDTVEFWLPYAVDAARDGMTIVLANLWESGPELQKRVIEVASHPGLRASFDNGHALVFSQRPASEWIKVLGSDLAHCHLHDNNGESDQHRSIGEGVESWPELFDALGLYAPEALVVLKCDRLEPNVASLAEAQWYLGTEGPIKHGSAR
ncbi:MAG: TIM barrel protein [Gemmatimonadetes bacterium]|nr:TIM barrel protein [Gemmatimonadota bacterium]